MALSGPELAGLAVLMLRGAQTPGELRQRAERLHQFSTIEELEAMLETLAQRRLIVRSERRPGQKEARWNLGTGFGVPSAVSAARPPEHREPPPGAVHLSSPASPIAELETRVSSLERELEALREVVARLREHAG